MSSGDRLSVWLPPSVRSGENVPDRCAARERSPRPHFLTASRTGSRARVLAQHYHGSQTVYELAVLGGRIDAVELGTSTRNLTGTDVDIVRPPSCAGATRATSALRLRSRVGGLRMGARRMLHSSIDDRPSRLHLPKGNGGPCAGPESKTCAPVPTARALEAPGTARSAISRKRNVCSWTASRQSGR